MPLPLWASLVPAGLGLLGNLFGGKGKKTEYTTMEPPWMQQMRQQAMQQMMRMGQTGPMGLGPTTQAYQNLMQRFYPGQAQGQVPGMGGGMPQMGFPQQQGPSSIPTLLGQYAQRYPSA